MDRFSEIYHNFFIGENTSYVTGTFTKDTQTMPKKDRVITLLFGGDVMLDRTTRTTIERSGAPYLTEKIKRIFWSQDVNMVNLEGTITDRPSISRVPQDNPEHFRFTFDKNHTQQFLTYNRINYASIGNNHITNFGTDGITQTTEFLQNAHITFIGTPTKENEHYTEKELYDTRIAFVTYNDFAPPQKDATLTYIRTAKTQNDLVIVYAHWGKEYYSHSTHAQQETAHALIDAGADIIIGSHPHVIEPIETYKGGIIFYSLGNLIFDQYFSPDVRNRLLVHTMIDDGHITFVLTPLTTNPYGQLHLASTELRTQILTDIAHNSHVSETIKNGIAHGMFTWR